MAPLHLLSFLAQTIRTAIYPHLGSRLGGEWAGVAHSGDTTFRLDVIAEDALDEILKEGKEPVALFTEDRGLVLYHDKPAILVIADPIDGTRPAAAGFESCVISLAACPFQDAPTFKDLTHGVLLEPFSGVEFAGGKGQGVEVRDPSGRLKVHPKTNTDPRKAFLAYEIAGRPFQEVAAILAPLLQECSLTAGAFCFNSSAYAISRIITGQLDAFVDVGGRLLQQEPGIREKFLMAGRGRVVRLFPYDIAAAYVLVREVGGVVSDALGRSLEEVPLMDFDERWALSCVAASNAELHEKIVKIIG